MPIGTPTESPDELRKQTANCASWFFWIAAMTMINSAMIHSGSETSFAIGLTFSMVVDGFTAESGAVAKLIAAGFNAGCAGALVFLGLKARRGQRWAFIVGFVFYGLDTLLSLVAPNAISIGLHAWALFSMGLGLRVAGRLRAAQSTAMAPPLLTPAVVPPLLAEPEAKAIGAASPV